MANYSHYDQLLSGNLPNIFNPDFAGGSLMDINYYNIYLNIALFGAPQSAVYFPNLYQGKIDTSGIMILRYDDFISEAAGAKDTWGVNFFQIEGERGYIYIAGGSNGIAQIKIVTKEREEILNEQPSPDRWFYEVQNLTALLLRDDREAIDRRLHVTLDVVKTIESARKEAGILFPSSE